MAPRPPLSTLLSQVLVAFTIELDNEFERRFEEAGGGARVTSFVMWSNLLRFVGEGVTVGELIAAVGLPRARALSRLGGVERWCYVCVAPADARPPSVKREGYGSARGTRDDWVVRPTAAGRRAAGIWPVLPGEVEARWRSRFGATEIDGLKAELRVVEARIDTALPDYLPIVSSTNGMALEVPNVAKRRESDDLPPVVLLAHALLAYTLEFEESSALSLPLSANVVRVLGEAGVPVRELPSLAGISKEAVAVALTSLTKSDYVVVEGASAATRTIALTKRGRTLQADDRRLHARIERRWATRLGLGLVQRLRARLEQILEHPDLSVGLAPYPDGWRASKPYAAHTKSVLATPRAAMPQYPMVLHRGGWPDGS